MQPKGTQFEQLKMLYDPEELMQMPSVDSYGSNPASESHAEMWEDKHADNQRTGMIDSVFNTGIRSPIILETVPGQPLTHGNGHHRTAAAAHIQRTTGREMYVPVVHDSDYMGYGLSAQFGTSEE